MVLVPQRRHLRAHRHRRQNENYRALPENTHRGTPARQDTSLPPRSLLPNHEYEQAHVWETTITIKYHAPPRFDGDNQNQQSHSALPGYYGTSKRAGARLLPAAGVKLHLRMALESNSLLPTAAFEIFCVLCVVCVTKEVGGRAR